MENLYFRQERETSNKKIYIYSILGFLGVVCLVAASISLSSNHSSSVLQQFAAEEDEFQAWMKRYNRAYSSQEEYERRLRTYLDNSVIVRIHNSLEYEFVLELNQFADMDYHEFSMKYLRTLISQRKQTVSKVAKPLKSYPSSVDWRTAGAVTAVKNQGSCGSCWAFSATGAIEGAWFLAGNELVSLSEQELMDCSYSYGNLACEGGWMDNAFEFVMQHGVTSEENYQYQEKNGTCNEALEADVVAKISDYTDVQENSTSALHEAIASTPVSVAVDASFLGWQFYKSGVITKYCSTSLNHGVLAVGYNDDATPPYYIVKNSWGEGWGESGYCRVGIKDGPGVCGIQMAASYPVV